MDERLRRALILDTDPEMLIARKQVLDHKNL
jgi:hypothetical protein